MLKFIDNNLLHYHLCNYKSNLKDAINIIENNHNRGLFLVNEDKRVVASLTDGDIRKALLRDSLLTDPVLPLANLNYKFLRNIAKENLIKEAELILNKYPSLSLIPHLDNEYRLKDLIINRWN